MIQNKKLLLIDDSIVGTQLRETSEEFLYQAEQKSAHAGVPPLLFGYDNELSRSKSNWI